MVVDHDYSSSRSFASAFPVYSTGRDVRNTLNVARTRAPGPAPAKGMRQILAYSSITLLSACIAARAMRARPRQCRSPAHRCLWPARPQRRDGPNCHRLWLHGLSRPLSRSETGCAFCGVDSPTLMRATRSQGGHAGRRAVSRRGQEAPFARHGRPGPDCPLGEYSTSRVLSVSDYSCL